MDTLAEVVMRPGMWWRTENDYWDAFGLVWREDGPEQPVVELRGRDWDGLVRAAADLGMTLDLAAEDAKGGHPKLDYPDDPEGAWFYKTMHPVQFHWVKQAHDYRLHAMARDWPTLLAFLDEMGVDVPGGDPAPKVKEGWVPAA